MTNATPALDTRNDRASLIALRFAQCDDLEAADRIAFAAAHRVWTAREIAVAGFAVDGAKVEALVETVIDEAASTVHIIAKGHPTLAEARERIEAAVRRSGELVE